MRQQTLKRGLSLWALILLASLILLVPRFSRAQSAAQAPARLPAAWNDAVTTLAGKIVNMAGRAKTISLSVKNISSLSTMDAARIRESLAAELTQRRLAIADEEAAQVHVTVTLSEGVQGYIWVAQVREGSDEQTAMVSVSKTNIARKDQEERPLVLEKNLVWQQQGEFLDFVSLISPVGFRSILVILKRDRLEYYQSTNGADWESWRSVPFPHIRTARSVRGFIDDEKAEAYLPYLVCTGILDPDRAQCLEKQVWPGPRLNPKVVGHEESEKELLPGRCREKSVVLATGNGDWTQPDTVQGYLLSDLNAEAEPSGSPIAMDGPVMSLVPDGRQSSARAVVRSLKTGNYEAYVITANCSP